MPKACCYSQVFCFFCNLVTFHSLLILANIGLFIGIGVFGLFISGDFVLYSVLFSMPFGTTLYLFIAILGLCFMHYKHQYFDVCFGMAALGSMFTLILAGNLYASGLNGLAFYASIKLSKNVSVAEIAHLYATNGSRAFSWTDASMLYNYTGTFADDEGGATYFAVPMVAAHANSTHASNETTTTAIWIVDYSQVIGIAVQKVILDKPIGIGVSTNPRNSYLFERMEKTSALIFLQKLYKIVPCTAIRPLPILCFAIAAPTSATMNTPPMPIPDCSSCAFLPRWLYFARHCP